MSTKMKILIGYDGSECADSAIKDLQSAGLPREAEVKVISVGELWLPPSYGLAEPGIAVEPAADLESVRLLASQASRKVESTFPDWEVSAKAAVGSPAREILETADEWLPDLIVVGSHGRSAFGRIVFGSVSQKVVTEALCSVRVARAKTGKDPDDPLRIIIGTDGSIGSHAAIDAAASRRWPKGSEAKLITSVGFPSAAVYYQAGMTHKEHEREDEKNRNTNYMLEIKKALHQAIEAELRAAGLSVESLVKEGDPKRVLIEEAEKWDADCIFVGSRGLSQLKRFLLGSVSTAVVTRANCSVEVVRAKEKVTS